MSSRGVAFSREHSVAGRGDPAIPFIARRRSRRGNPVGSAPKQRKPLDCFAALAMTVLDLFSVSSIRFKVKSSRLKQKPCPLPLVPLTLRLAPLGCFSGRCMLNSVRKAASAPPHPRAHHRPSPLRPDSSPHRLPPRRCALAHAHLQHSRPCRAGAGG